MTHLDYVCVNPLLYICVCAQHAAAFAKKPYKRDYILQKSPIKEAIFCKRDRTCLRDTHVSQRECFCFKWLECVCAQHAAAFAKEPHNRDYILQKRPRI